MSPTPQWFKTLGPCGRCAVKAATGVLMSNRNDPMGPRCEMCATSEIRLAKNPGMKIR